jgi:hypothetical protein
MIYGLWDIMYPSGSMPDSREGSATIMYENNLYIFGGFSRDIFNDLRVLDMNN